MKNKNHHNAPYLLKKAGKIAERFADPDSQNTNQLMQPPQNISQ